VNAKKNKIKILFLKSVLQDQTASELGYEGQFLSCKHCKKSAERQDTLF